MLVHNQNLIKGVGEDSLSVFTSSAGSVFTSTSLTGANHPITKPDPLEDGVTLLAVSRAEQCEVRT